MDGSKPTVNLWYLGGNTYGGWVTFTAHLYHGLKSAGYNVLIRKVGNNTEEKHRPFGYGCYYTNVSELEFPDFKGDVNIIVSSKPKKAEHVFDLMLMGASIVIHDPTEIKGENEVHDAILCTKSPVIVIRRKNLGLFPDRTQFLPHPYVMRFGHGEPSHEKIAVSISRIDFDKKLNILLDANRLLPDGQKIDIRGFENRIYTKFQICPEYPEWVQSKAHYPREMDFAVNLCRQSTFMCDMSAIKGDGGGTQYTFLEAWDAGSIIIINRAWIEGLHSDFCVMEEDENCFVVSDGEELASKLLSCYNRLLRGDAAGEFLRRKLVKMRAKGWRTCLQHDARQIAPEFVRVTLER